MVTACFLLDTLRLSGVASLIPRFVLPLTLCLLLIELTVGIMTKAGSGAQASVTHGTGAKSPAPTGLETPPLQTFLWVAVLPATLWLLGLTAGASVYCFLFMKWRSKESWKFSLAFSLSLGVLLHLLFSTVLQAELHAGVIPWQSFRP